MRTDTATHHAPARFAVGFLAWSLLLFGVLRLGWVEQHVLLPLTTGQAAIAAAVVGPGALPVYAALECSGADVIALCLGAILAYPARWRRRFAGIAGGIGLILVLNVFRIGSLGRTVASPDLFQVLHVYVWPAILTLAVGAYLLLWTRRTGRETGGRQDAVEGPPSSGPNRSRAFVTSTIVLVPVFVLIAPLSLDSPAVLSIAGVIARGAALALTALGATASASANVLFTDKGPLLVTQECITTPLIPVYLAAVMAFSRSVPQRVLGWAAALPLFMLLGILRLLVVALPAAVVASPLFLIHAFYQLLLGVTVIGAVALWQHGRHAAARPALGGLLAAVAFVAIVGTSYSTAVIGLVGMPAEDPQGAIAFLPAFQVGLYLALSVVAWPALGWRRWSAGLLALAATQVVALLILDLAAGSGLEASVRDVRAWAVAGPLLLFLAARRRRRPLPMVDRAHAEA